MMPKSRPRLPDASTLVCPICAHKSLTKTKFCYFSDPLMQEYACPECGTKGTAGYADLTHTEVSYGHWLPLTRSYFMWLDDVKGLVLRIDGKDYDPDKVRYITPKLLILTDGTKVPSEKKP